MFARSAAVPAPSTGSSTAMRGVEVVEARVDEGEADDLLAEDLADLAVAVAGGAEAGAGEDRVADEQEVALALVDLDRARRRRSRSSRNQSMNAGPSGTRSWKRNFAPYATPSMMKPPLAV